MSRYTYPLDGGITLVLGFDRMTPCAYFIQEMNYDECEEVFSWDCMFGAMGVPSVADAKVAVETARGNPGVVWALIVENYGLMPETRVMDLQSGKLTTWKALRDRAMADLPI